MNCIRILGGVGIVICLLAACGPSITITSQVTETVPVDTQESTPLPLQITETLLAETRESNPYPLSEPGPYWVGNREYTLLDNNREGRKIKLTILYPALKQTNADGNFITRDAVPDISGAQYPLILTGTNSGNYLFKSHLASHGFVMAIVQYPDPIAINWGFEMIDHPRDILFALDQISSNPPEGLEGVIDTDHVGVTGYSSDGSYSLTVSGACVDPEFYLSQCEQAALTDPKLSQWFCGPAKNWDNFVAHAGSKITVSDDGLWQPMTDKRIRAVMPMAPNGAWLYGERGLAMVNMPVFIINATEDEYVPYQIEAAYIYEHLEMAEKYLVSFIGKTHMMVENQKQAARIKHFVTAFFGYYLQGREEYAEYFSEDFVAQFDDLAWGVYKK